MPHGIAVIECYASRPPENVLDVAFTSAELAGFATDEAQKNSQAGADNATVFNVSYDSQNFRFFFTLDEDRDPGNPLLRVDCGEAIYPSEADSEAAYRDLMDALFELLCRLAVDLNVDYAALFNPENRNALAHSRPFDDGVSELPRLGIYAQQVVDQFGGIDAMFDSSPWYTAELDEDKTVIADAESGWLDGPWQPPIDAPYLVDARFDTTATPADQELADPFGSFATGAYGADLCVPREQIGPEFRNEDLELVRAHVDERGDLRRVADDSFVRNVVTDSTTDKVEVVKRQLADVPADERESDLMVSTLLHGAIPPSFVRLDEPDGENVVTRVMNLDVDTNKVELLISLGRAAQHGDGMDVATIESALDELAGLEDSDGVDRWIEQNLL